MMKISRYLLLIIVFLSLFFACKKDKEEEAPLISFKSGSAYTQDGAIVAVGHPLFFGIQATAGTENITNFTIKKELENGSEVTVMDTAVFTDYLDIDKRFFQNVEDVVKWKFAVMDRNRLTAEISLEVYKDPNSTFGGIYYFPSIKLGFQQNTQFGHFLNPSTGVVYTTDSASTYQQSIDVLVYFKSDEVPPAPILSSAGEMDNFSTDAQTFYPDIVNWTTRNYTLWDISVDNDPISTQDFDAAQNDSLLIVSYEAVWGKKKFKWATAGKVIPFLTAGGKLGLVKVIYTDDAENGYMEIAVKIQQ